VTAPSARATVHRRAIGGSLVAGLCDHDGARDRPFAAKRWRVGISVFCRENRTLYLPLAATEILKLSSTASTDRVTRPQSPSRYREASRPDRAQVFRNACSAMRLATTDLRTFAFGISEPSPSPLRLLAKQDRMRLSARMQLATSVRAAPLPSSPLRQLPTRVLALLSSSPSLVRWDYAVCCSTFGQSVEESFRL
jgi:hypothetical protein